MKQSLAVMNFIAAYYSPDIQTSEESELPREGYLQLYHLKFLHCSLSVAPPLTYLTMHVYLPLEVYISDLNQDLNSKAVQ